MPRFRKRGNTWTCEVRRKGFKPIARTFDTKAQAGKWATNVESQMLKGQYVDTREAEVTTLAEALERYAREVTPKRKVQKTSCHGLYNGRAHTTLTGMPLSLICEIIIRAAAVSGGNSMRVSA